MSDNNRETFTTKADSALKPDQQKTSTEQTGDKLRGKADTAAATLQPESKKSTTQKASDTLQGSGESVVDRAKETVGLGNKGNKGDNK